MRSIALLCLIPFLFSSQQSKPETVALVFGPDPVRIEIVKTEDAEAQYDQLKPKHEAGTLTEAEAKRFAALTQALGTLPRVESVPTLGTRERLDWEIRRGVRPPLQKSGGN